MITGPWIIPDPIHVSGQSGKTYVSNPMGVSKYGFSTFLDGRFIGLTAENEVYLDAESVPMTKERWKVISPEGRHEIICQQDGSYEGGNICEYLELLIEKHGFEAIDATKCITTN